MAAEHPNLVHWDDVPWEHVDVGELRFAEQCLGAAAGAFRSGVNRYRIEPGGRSSPAHVHADEEELFYVLSGSGLAWLDGATYAIGPGDALCHRVHEEPHTLIGGPDGLEVLAFGPQSEPNITWLPHAQVLRVGPHWVPVDGPEPFAAEAAAGPLPVPATPSPDLPPTIVPLGAVAEDLQDRVGFELYERDLGRAAGSETTGLCHVVLVHEAQNWPLHWHTMEEELFVVLDGDGEVLLGEAAFPVRRGSVVARPPQAREGHAFRAGAAGLTYLAWGTRVPGDIVYYPNSKKVNLRGLHFRVEPLDYWDGE